MYARAARRQDTTTGAAARAWAGDHPGLSWVLLEQAPALGHAIAQFGPLLR